MPLVPLSQTQQHYNLVEHTPPAILERLRSGVDGKIPETPKPGDALFRRVQNLIIASNRHAAQAAVEEAEECGLTAMLLSTYLQGEARQLGMFLGAIARQLHATRQPIQPPACLIAGGETTVTLQGDGMGGRNQEVALGAVRGMDGVGNLLLVTLATDGDDGPTDAAGAVVSGETLKRALSSGMSPEDYLDRNDSYHFFDALGDLIRTGPTQTNVNDLMFLFAFAD